MVLSTTTLELEASQKHFLFYEKKGLIILCSAAAGWVVERYGSVPYREVIYRHRVKSSIIFLWSFIKSKLMAFPTGRLTTMARYLNSLSSSRLKDICFRLESGHLELIDSFVLLIITRATHGSYEY